MEKFRIRTYKSGILAPDCKELVKNYIQSELNNQFIINIQILFFKNTKFIPQQPDFSDIAINPVKLAKDNSFVENEFFDEKAYIISIVDSKKDTLLKSLSDNALDIGKREKNDLKIKPKQPNFVSDIEEVDLHIDELVDNAKELTPGEIIQIQLARFETTLNGNLISQKVKRMVFIHGVGNGKLKHELRKLLEKKYPKLKYQDASFKEYGYGATLVYLK